MPGDGNGTGTGTGTDTGTGDGTGSDTGAATNTLPVNLQQGTKLPTVDKFQPHADPLTNNRRLSDFFNDFELQAKFLNITTQSRLASACLIVGGLLFQRVW